MKTKILFIATLVAALFTSCTKDTREGNTIVIHSHSESESVSKSISYLYWGVTVDAHLHLHARGMNSKFTINSDTEDTVFLSSAIDNLSQSVGLPFDTVFNYSNIANNELFEYVVSWNGAASAKHTIYITYKVVYDDEGIKIHNLSRAETTYDNAK